MLLCHNLIVIITISGLFCAKAQNEIRDHYSFNHPPLIETLESVALPSPVAVAYKSGDAREEKSIDLSTNYQTTSEEESYPIKKNYETVPGYIKNKSSEIEEPEKLENKNEGHSFSNSNSIKIPDLEIPVNVVYDTESEVEYVNKGNDQIINRSNKKQKQVTRRLHKSKIDENIKDEVAINDNKHKEEKSIGNTVSIKSSTPLPLEKNELNTASPINIVKERRRMRTRPPVVPIVTEKNFVYGHSGNFHYSFEGGDGTKVFEEGSLKTINDDTGEAVYGGFSYKDKDGKDYSLSYTADENGYQPIGAHLPTPPPIPPAIARALAYLATKSIPQSTEATKKFA